MGSILYFIAGEAGAAEAVLRARNLSGVLAGLKPTTRGIYNGPEGKSGVLLAGNPSGDIGYFPDRQTWRKGTRGDFWLGFDPEDPPTPEDLARPRLVSGHTVEMRGGGKWTIPVARSFPVGTGLPQIIVLDETGTVTTETVPEFVDLSRRAEKIWTAMIEAAAAAEEKRAAGDETAVAVWSISFAERFEIAVAALAVNYRLEADEISLLKIMEGIHQDQILYALVDGPALDLFAKKNSIPESSPTTDGEAASCPTTAPPSATSKSCGES